MFGEAQERVDLKDSPIEAAAVQETTGALGPFSTAANPAQLAIAAYDRCKGHGSTRQMFITEVQGTRWRPAAVERQPASSFAKKRIPTSRCIARRWSGWSTWTK